MAKQGYIRNKLDMKMLELYLLARAAGPVEPNLLMELIMRHDGAEYFDFTEATAELVESGHVERRNSGYVITQRGRLASADTEAGLPYSVRRRCAQDLAPVNAALRRNAQIQGEKLRNEAGDPVARLTLDDDGGRLLSIEVLCPSEEQCDRMIAAFKARPEQIYNEVLEVLLTAEQDGTEER